MRVLLDTSYLYGLMEAQGRFSDEQRRFFRLCHETVDSLRLADAGWIV